MPEIDQNELIAHVEWNENIHIDENRKRVTELFGEADRLGAQHTAYIGQQQFLLNRDRELSISEVELYFKTEETDAIAPLQQRNLRLGKAKLPDSRIIVLSAGDCV